MSNIDKIKNLFFKEEKTNKIELNENEFKMLVEELAHKKFSEIELSKQKETKIIENSKPVESVDTSEKDKALTTYIIELGEK